MSTVVKSVPGEEATRENKRLSDLYGKYPGQDIYVVGTGTSMRVFPTGFFDGKITIGLNQAWKLIEPTYCITMMPKLNIPEFIAGERPRPDIIWITKEKKVTTQCSADELAHSRRNHYFFDSRGRRSINGLDEPSEAGRCLEWVAEPHPTNLYLWTSISQSAVNLATNMGARNVILCGCDNAAIGQNHHAHGQHTMWKGEDPERRYHQYYEGLLEMRAVLRNRGVSLLSMSPFLKLDAFEEDFRHLCHDLGLATHIENSDQKPPNSSLRGDNARYLKLTRYILRKNASHIFQTLRGKRPI